MSHKIPAIPDPSTVEPVDFSRVIKEAVELLQGVRGSGDLRAVTLSEIVKPAQVGAILLNGWANYGIPYRDVGFFIGVDRVVHMFGVAVPPATFNSTAFVLGREYAPAGKLLFPLRTTAGGTVSMTIEPVSGQVDISTTTDPVSFDGVSFNLPVRK